MVETDYHFGPFRFDAARGYLSKQGEPLAVGARALQLLAVLLERKGNLVTKGELVEILWPSVIVEEGNLSTQVWSLRKALADTERPNRWIVTVPGRGYRFAGEAVRSPRTTSSLDEARLETVIAAADPAPAAHNLPNRLIKLIGRERDLEALTAMLARHRLASIVGAGGLGKTQLALHVSGALVGVFPDGVWFVSLERLNKPDEIGETIAGLFGLAIPGGLSPAKVLSNFLGRKELLLVLDNCEHLVLAAAQLLDAILTAAPSVKALTTSREPLRLPYERVLRLRPLDCPPVGQDLAVEEIGRYAAVALFVERAIAALGEFALTPSTARIVVEICNRLDGIALAIELAAARLRVLALPDLLAAIEDRFRILTAGSRAAAQRHRTLEAAIDWGYDLLTPSEQRFFCRLAVFGGSFSLESAARVAADADDVDDAFERLASLVEKSLVIATTQPAGRFRLFESMRAFGLARLEADDAAASRKRLTDFLIELFERAEIERRTTSTTSWIDKYGSELDNLRASLTWAFGQDGDRRRGIRLVSRTSEIWTDSSLARERLRWLDIAAANLDDDTPSDIRGRILYSRLPALYSRRELPANLIEAIALLRRTDDKLSLALALRLAAMALSRDGDVAEAEPYLEESEALVRPYGLTRALLLILTTKATLRKMAGDFNAARQAHAECSALSRSLGNPLTLATSRINLAELDFAEGNVAAAIAGARDACAVSRQSGMSQNLSDALQNLAAYLLFEGDVAGGRAAAIEAIDLKQSLDAHPWLAYSLEHLALAAALDGDIATAARLAGYTDHRIQADSGGREATEQIGWTKLSDILAKRLVPEDRARLTAEGQIWSEDIAVMAARGELTLP